MGQHEANYPHKREVGKCAAPKRSDMGYAMFNAVGQLIRRFPAFSLLILGIWIGASPWLFVSFVKQLMTQNLVPGGLAEFLKGLGDRTDLPCAVVFVFGVALAVAAVGWMVVRSLGGFRCHPG